MYQYSCVHTYIPTYLHTYIPTYLPTYLHTYIPTYLPTYIQTDRQTDRQTTCIHAYMSKEHLYLYISIHIYLYFHIYVYDIFEHSPIPSTLHFMAWHCITYVWIHIYSKCILYICVCVCTFVQTSMYAVSNLRLVALWIQILQLTWKAEIVVTRLFPIYWTIHI